MHARRLPLLVAAVALWTSGCYSNPSKFNKDIAKRSCDWLYECYRADAENIYSSYDDCVDTQREGYDDNEASCSYNDDEARECMKWVKDHDDDCSMNYLEAVAKLVDECKDVYYDCELASEIQDTDGEPLASYPDAI